jgi:hypothetical protein
MMVLIALRIPSIGDAKRQCSCRANECTSATWHKMKHKSALGMGTIFGDTVHSGCIEPWVGAPAAGWLDLASAHRRSQLPRDRSSP